jgi:lipopolysaccharide export system ATP-binding protein
MPILEVEGLVKSFGSRKVVDGVSFAVDRAEIVGLLGPNGAGKTTSFRMTCGMIPPDRGSVTLNGVDVTAWPMYRRCKEGMGYLAQEASIFKRLTTEQNLLGVMELMGIPRQKRRRRCDDLLEQFKITHIRKSKAGSLSGGERRRLEIARCLVAEPGPEIILLDEPFTGIDPVTIQNIQEIVKELKSRGISILITDHQVRETLEITDRSYVVVKGQVLCHGTPKEVLSHPEARKLYFGSGIEVDGPQTSRASVHSATSAAQIAPVPAATPPLPVISAVPPPKGLSRPRTGSVHEEETLTE